MSSRLPSSPGSVPEYACCDDGKPGRRASGKRMSRHSALSALLVSQLPSPSGRDLSASRTRGSETPHGGASPERRCSSRTFRYGYLVTT